MADIIRTWPANVDAHSVAHMFGPTCHFAMFYFTLGRGKPKQPVTRLWFTYQGRILGSFAIKEVVQNDGSLPRLRSITNEDSEWQIRPDHWVAICPGPMDRLKDRVFMSGFRGYRYFNLAEYRTMVDSKVRL
jgi:hypothetical protein